MRDWTPSTKFVRELFATTTPGCLCEAEKSDALYEAFDRWLAAHDAQVRAEERERIAQAIEEWWSEQETSGVFTGGAWSSGARYALSAALGIAREAT